MSRISTAAGVLTAAATALTLTLAPAAQASTARTSITPASGATANDGSPSRLTKRGAVALLHDRP